MSRKSARQLGTIRKHVKGSMEGESWRTSHGEKNMGRNQGGCIIFVLWRRECAEGTMTEPIIPKYLGNLAHEHHHNSKKNDPSTRTTRVVFVKSSARRCGEGTMKNKNGGDQRGIMKKDSGRRCG